MLETPEVMLNSEFCTWSWVWNGTMPHCAPFS